MFRLKSTILYQRHLSDFLLSEPLSFSFDIGIRVVLGHWSVSNDFIQSFVGEKHYAYFYVHIELQTLTLFT